MSWVVLEAVKHFKGEYSPGDLITSNGNKYIKFKLEGTTFDVKPDVCIDIKDFDACVLELSNSR